MPFLTTRAAHTAQEETWIEMPIPEQFVHKIVTDTKSKKGKRLATDVSDLYS